MRRWFSGCLGGGATTCKRSDHPPSPAHHPNHQHLNSADPEQQLSGRPLKSILKKSPSDGLEGSFSPSSGRYRYLPPSRRPHVPLNTHVVLQPFGRRRVDLGGREDFGPRQKQVPGQFNTHIVLQQPKRHQVDLGARQKEFGSPQGQARGQLNSHIVLGPSGRRQVDLRGRQEDFGPPQGHACGQLNSHVVLRPSGRRQLDLRGRQEDFEPLQGQARGHFNSRVVLQPSGRRQLDLGERQEDFESLQRRERGQLNGHFVLQPSERQQKPLRKPHLSQISGRSFGPVPEQFNTCCLVGGSKSRSLDTNFPLLPTTREAWLNSGDAIAPRRCKNLQSRNPWNALPPGRQHRWPLTSYFGARSGGDGSLSSWRAGSLQGRIRQFVTSSKQHCIPPRHPRLPTATGRQVNSS